MADLITDDAGALVNGVLRLGFDGHLAVAGYTVTTARTPDGVRYDVRTPDGELVSWTAPIAGERTLVLGGARSGKSTAAERLLAGTPNTLYVATGYAAEGDPEWAERIALHQARRPSTWDSVETIDLVPLLATDGPPLLIDCLTLWLTRTMDAADVWTSLDRVTEVERQMDALVGAWSTTRRRVVAVSNEVGSGIVPADAPTRLFRDLMGRLNTTLAHHATTVLWCTAGRTLAL
ncbi:bifunctional adenosylcobinamide kinase/adenosylcobinamide-phosphate guanylyltransferase [Kribbella sp. NBC_01245]|uniref:bifunctional adenosylcobinamide kinase/adenosylcobinamide-phosphate guanylyltransferase n=1 Tax=Kribbella sp. NBC_01245 TaxID=2903578 RepID=UPI002E299024|nr:bifunctional adenosylcobinamide kinase/adenosylcobinamide-phosphate guanylyltransferase [Kribbella sp. NBC_01245]